MRLDAFSCVLCTDMHADLTNTITSLCIFSNVGRMGLYAKPTTMSAKKAYIFCFAIFQEMEIHYGDTTLEHATYIVYVKGKAAHS